jgi:tetratricopeptide (TPR) repeat protein
MATEHNPGSQALVTTLSQLEQQVNSGAGKTLPPLYYTNILKTALPRLSRELSSPTSTSPNIVLAQLCYIIGTCLRAPKGGNIDLPPFPMIGLPECHFDDSTSKKTRSEFALKLFEYAALQGYHSALNFLYCAHKYGSAMTIANDGLEILQNDAKAAEYQARREEHREPVALFFLAKRLMSAAPDRAKELFTISYQAGFLPASCYVAKYLYDREPGLAAGMWGALISSPSPATSRLHELFEARNMAISDAGLLLFYHGDRTGEELLRLESYLVGVDKTKVDRANFTHASMRLARLFHAKGQTDKAIHYAKDINLDESGLLLAQCYLTPGPHYDISKASEALAAFIRHNTDHPDLNLAHFVQAACTFSLPPQGQERAISLHGQVLATWEGLAKKGFLPAQEAMRQYQEALHSYLEGKDYLTESDKVNALKGDPEALFTSGLQCMRRKNPTGLSLLMLSARQAYPDAIFYLLHHYASIGDGTTELLAILDTLPLARLPLPRIHGYVEARRTKTAWANKWLVYAASKGSGSAAVYCFEHFKDHPQSNLAAELLIQLALVVRDATDIKDDIKRSVIHFLECDDFYEALTNALYNAIAKKHTQLKEPTAATAVIEALRKETKRMVPSPASLTFESLAGIIKGTASGSWYKFGCKPADSTSLPVPSTCEPLPALSFQDPCLSDSSMMGRPIMEAGLATLVQTALNTPTYPLSEPAAASSCVSFPPRTASAPSTSATTSTPLAVPVPTVTATSLSSGLVPTPTVTASPLPTDGPISAPTSSDVTAGNPPSPATDASLVEFPPIPDHTLTTPSTTARRKESELELA